MLPQIPTEFDFAQILRKMLPADMNVGAVNPALQVRPKAFNGVDASAGLSYRLRTMNQTLSLRTTPGWDDVTGMGTPNSAFLAVFGS